MFSSVFVPTCVLFSCIQCTFAIIGGRNASSHQFPFMVSLQNAQGQHVNGGSIIAKTFVLTDAYTLHANRGKLMPYHVLAGTVTLSGPGISYRIKSTHLHPRYDEIQFLSNIGIVQVDGRGFMYTEDIQPIPLGTINIEGNVPILAMGWGVSEHPINSLSDGLKFATLLSLSQKEVDQLLPGTIYEGRNDYVHAVGYQHSGASVCQYDMGGPLIAGYTIVGIISWDKNRSCSFSSPYPSSALRVTSHISWIEQIIFNLM